MLNLLQSLKYISDTIKGILKPSDAFSSDKKKRERRKYLVCYDTIKHQVYDALMPPYIWVRSAHVLGLWF